MWKVAAADTQLTPKTILTSLLNAKQWVACSLHNCVSVRQRDTECEGGTRDNNWMCLQEKLSQIMWYSNWWWCWQRGSVKYQIEENKVFQIKLLSTKNWKKCVHHWKPEWEESRPVLAKLYWELPMMQTDCCSMMP